MYRDHDEWYPVYDLEPVVDHAAGRWHPPIVEVTDSFVLRFAAAKAEFNACQDILSNLPVIDEDDA
jgi:hypothetical protein